MSHLFEIHITVDHTQGLYKLYEYAENNKLKTVLAVSKTGVHKDQYMLTKWVRCNTNIAILSAQKISQDLEKDYNIKVLRTKVEAVATFEYMDNYFAENKSKLDNYFEFHFNIENCNNLTNLEKCINNIKRLPNSVLGTSINFMGENLPLITVRCYLPELTKANDICTYYKSCLSKEGYMLSTKMQSEFSVFDNNLYIDNGWLQ